MESSFIPAILAAGKAIIAFMATNPIGWIALIGTAIAAVIIAVSAFTKSTAELAAEQREEIKVQQEINQKTIETVNSQRQEIDSQNDLIAVYQQKYAEYKKLKEGSDEQKAASQELKEILNQLKDKHTELIPVTDNFAIAQNSLTGIFEQNKLKASELNTQYLELEETQKRLANMELWASFDEKIAGGIDETKATFLGLDTARTTAIKNAAWQGDIETRKKNLYALIEEYSKIEKAGGLKKTETTYTGSGMPITREVIEVSAERSRTVLKSLLDSYNQLNAIQNNSMQQTSGGLNAQANNIFNLATATEAQIEERIKSLKEQRKNLVPDSAEYKKLGTEISKLEQYMNPKTVGGNTTEKNKADAVNNLINSYKTQKENLELNNRSLIELEKTTLKSINSELIKTDLIKDNIEKLEKQNKLLTLKNEITKSLSKYSLDEVNVRTPIFEGIKQKQTEVTVPAMPDPLGGKTEEQLRNMNIQLFTMRALTESIADGFNSAGSAVASAMSSAVQVFGQANSLLQIFINNLAQAIVQSIALKAVNAVLGFVMPGIGGLIGSIFGGGTGAIPAVANGGIFTKPTFTLIGEGNEPEGVFPLSKLFNYMQTPQANPHSELTHKFKFEPAELKQSGMDMRTVLKLVEENIARKR